MIGAGALRINDLYLAIVTFALGVAASQYLYRTTLLSDDNQSTVPFRRGTLFGLELDSQRTFYYVLLATLVVMMIVLTRLRASGVGRSIIAVRDNPRSAAAMTVSPMRMRVIAFAISGGIAGFGGALLAGAIQTVPLTDRFFQVNNSLELVAMAVIGGLGTVVGAGARPAVGRRPSGVLPRQRTRAAARLRRRPAGAAPVLPRRPRPARLQRPRRRGARRRTPPRPGRRQVAGRVDVVADTT